MSEAVERRDIDMCGLGRPLREDPEFVNKVLRGEICRSNLQVDTVAHTVYSPR
jgi:2,4-dienoyl-CoA reductase-like NADH-dependent reductase (Old Yellow Enzyme family)